MSFCTAINCMDGRVQLPVNEFMRRRCGVAYVDTITEPGLVRILAEQDEPLLVNRVLQSIAISVDGHGSRAICVAAHHDCAGNPASKAAQVAQIRQAIALLRGHFPAVEIIGVWVDESWTAHEV